MEDAPTNREAASDGWQAALRVIKGPAHPSETHTLLAYWRSLLIGVAVKNVSKVVPEYYLWVMIRLLSITIILSNAPKQKGRRMVQPGGLAGLSAEDITVDEEGRVVVTNPEVAEQLREAAAAGAGGAGGGTNSNCHGCNSAAGCGVKK